MPAPDGRARRPTLAVLKLQDYAAWDREYARGACAGDLGPYGLRALERLGFDLSWTDAAHRQPWRSAPIARPLRKLSHVRPELAGARNALVSAPLLARAHATLAVFEDQGLFVASAKARHLRPFAARPLALISCWLAESAGHLDERTLMALRRALAATELVMFFSANQRRIFEELYGLDPARLAAIPFGVDHRFFAPSAPGAAAVEEKPLILAVGRDRSRDHDLLAAAVRGTGMRVRLIGTPPSTGAPPEMELSDAVDHLAYRALLARAAVVVVPTHAPQYPGGQTVVLEAMSMGRAVVTTDSAAMRDYVTPGVTGELVARGDARELATALGALLADPDRRRRLGAAGRRAVETRFNDIAMWQAVAGHLSGLIPAALAAPSDRPPAG
jgi:glycosyltransferase involved in cell wall biosynthesis